MSQNVANAFRREFEILLDCLADTIRAVSDEDWVRGDAPRHTPAHQACHCLMPIVRYIQADVDADALDFRFKVPSVYPTREHAIEVLDRVRAAIDGYVTDVVGRTLVDRELGFPPLFKALYLLRHSTTHLSYLRDELHRRGYKLSVHTKSYRPRT